MPPAATLPHTDPAPGPGRPVLPPVPRLLAAVLPVAAVAVLGSLSTTPNIPTWYAGLAKPGFSQSYTYFTWRQTSDELRAYFNELAHGPGRHPADAPAGRSARGRRLRPADCAFWPLQPAGRCPHNPRQTAPGRGP